MDRVKKILKKINVAEGIGLELGPLARPTISKKEGKIFYADHMSTSDLRKKYKGHSFNLDEIVDVDYVVSGKSLPELVGKKKFDYIIASHVIEHIPNTVEWLKEISSILKLGGTLSLVVPDKRYTFDVNRQLSRPADVMEAYLHKVKVSTFAMKYDHLSNTQDVHPVDAWQDRVAKKRPARQITEAFETAKKKSYVDVHCYTYTSESFFEIMRHLIVHDLTDFRVSYFQDTIQNEQEFFVTLEKQKTRDKAKQLRSLPVSIADDSREVIKVLQTELHGVYRSRSWNITRPVRYVTTVIRRRLKK